MVLQLGNADTYLYVQMGCMARLNRQWFNANTAHRHGSGGRRCRSGRVGASVAALSVVFAISCRADLTPPISPLDQDFECRIWTQHHGLPDNEIRDILPSSEGYLWISTRAGLARFDGREFVIFTAGSVPEMRSNECGVLAEDAAGSVWVGTSDGLLRFDRTIHRFEPGMISMPGDTEGIRSGRNHITALCAAPSGGLWVGTHRGLLLWHKGIFHTVPLINREGELARSSLYRLFIHALFDHPDVGAWAGIGWGPILYDPTVPAFRIAKAVSNPKFPGLAASAFCRTPEGTFFALISAVGPSQAARLHRWTGEEWVPVSQRWVSNGSRRFWLRADSEGRLWIPDAQGAILSFEDGEFRRLELPLAMHEDYVTCLVEDREGSLWLGTESRGIARLRPSRVERITTTSGLPDPNVRAVCAARNGDLWLGTDGGLVRVRAGKAHVFGESHGLNISELRAVAMDRAGRVWAGGRPGAFVLDSSGSQFRQLPFDGEWYNAKVRAILPGADGLVWVATATGLYPFTADRGEPLPQVEGLAGKDVRSLLEAASGALWVGTEDKGLFGVRGGEMVAHHLDGASVYALWEDARGVLWAGTRVGLARILGPRIGWITTRHGLPEDLINALIEDDHGWFWIGGESGIHRVRREALEAILDGHQSRVFPIQYGTEEGLGGVETHGQISQPSAVKAPDGRIWFPTANGVVAIDPDRVPDIVCPPPVLIEAVRADGRLVYSNQPLEQEGRLGGHSPGSGATTLVQSEPGRSIRADVPLRFAPGTAHAIEFRFTACTFVEADSVQFFHRIDGVDDDWVEAGRRRSAAYFNLAPGQYRFHLKARNKYGIESALPAAMRFFIVPHFHQTAGFYVLGGTVALAVAGGAWRWRLAGLRRLQRLEQQLALARERERLARDLHDVLGSRLHQISLLSESPESSGVPDADALLAQLSRSSRQALGSLKDVIWATYPQNDTVRSLVGRLQLHAEDFLVAAQLNYRIQLPEELPEVALSADHRVSLFNAFQEALTNVVRHAQARQVWIRVSCSQSDLVLSVTDDGQGFDPLTLDTDGPRNGEANGHHGLSNMRRRIETCRGGRFELDSRPGGGTTIRMRVGLP